MTVDFSENHSCHIIIIIRKIISAKLLIIISVHNTDKRILNHTEMLISLSCLIDIDNKNDVIIGRRQVLQIHEDLLVITFAGTCEIISHVPYTLAAMHKIAEIDNVGVVHKLTVMAYNRVVADTNGLDEDSLLKAICQAGFEIGEPADHPVTPTDARSFGLYAFGKWRQITYVGEAPSAQVDPAGALDVSILQEHLLGPVLGIDDPRTSKRITFVGGIEGTEGLERRAGTTGIAFTLFPTTVDQLMGVSDAGMLMPPKSTWFEPKLRSGLFIRRI
jgi:hypothetical protein